MGTNSDDDKSDGDKVKVNDPKTEKKSCDASAAKKCTELASSASSCGKAQDLASCFFDAGCCQVGAGAIMVANTQMNCNVECVASTNGARQTVTSICLALILA